jgi:putative ABC transport system permease protein
MRLTEIYRLVLLNIFENKFKVVLTSIGIVVGAATIVLVIAVGRGGQMDVADQFKNLNAASIEITSTSGSTASGQGGFTRAGGGATRSPVGGGATGGISGGTMPPLGFGGFGSASLNTVNATLTEEDAEDIAFFLPNVIWSTISVNGKKAVLGGNMEEEAQYTVAAIKPDYGTISNLAIYVGDFITEQDEEGKTKVCVIGNKLATDLFENPINAFDSIISIEGTNFTVIGVLQSMGTVASGISPDDAVYIPYSTGSKYVFGKDASPQITVVADSTDSVQKAIENCKTMLNENYPGASFTFSDAGSKMEAAQQSSRTLSMLLMAVAAIVFLVGGIGIMNVLFVSVKERTKEIGVLKALGMQRIHVLVEFLMEAMMISVLGGVLGVALSLAAIPVAEQLGVRMEPTYYAYFAAFGFAVICGTIFGFYPAFKASKLIPVQALTQE